MSVPAILRGRSRYARRMDGRIDDAAPDAFAYTVRLEDDDGAVELALEALPSPAYAIRRAVCRALAGEVAPSVVAGAAGLAGLRMVAGFTRAARAACGPGAGSSLVVDAAIEAARLARQTTRLPPERVHQLADSPAGCWELDTAGWPDLPGSCFTYSDAGRARLGQAGAVSMRPELYAPPAGARGLFTRAKLARVEARDGRLCLAHAMHDDVHGFELALEAELATGRILSATSRTPRLPYAGICTEPQARIARLEGETLAPDLKRRIGPLLGGASGCAQLHDLVLDLLKLLGEG